MRARTRWKAALAWRRISCSSRVSSFRPRISTRPSTIVVSTALPFAAKTRCEYSCSALPCASGVNMTLRVSTSVTSALRPGLSWPVSCPGGAVHERGELHHLEHVQAVVALGGVVAEPDVQARGEHLRQPGDAVAELGVRARVVRDLRAGLPHQGDLGVGQPDAMGGDGVAAEQ